VKRRPAEKWDLNHLLVENSLGLFCTHDLDGVLLFVNPAAAESLGYKTKEIIGRNLRDFLAPSVHRQFDAYLERIQTVGADSGPMRVKSKDGSERVWMYRNKRVDPHGAQPLVLGHALDITERIAAEKALKEARAGLQQAHDELAHRVRERTAELQAANEQLRAQIEQRKQMEEELLRARKLESLGMLAGGIAHDFNNFLTVIQGNLAVAEMQLKSGSEEISETLGEIAGACRRAAALSSQLLTFARGGAPIRRQVSVAALIRSAVDLARAGSPISVDLELAEDLWPAEADPGQLTQVLQNVLLNARQAMPQGGTIAIRAANTVLPANGARTAGRYVRIVVRDQGCGIPPEALPLIFDPYFTTKKSASGLGLATAYAIITKHRGNIAVESQAGLGATVTIDVPASQQPVATERGGKAKPAITTGKVLVMDDEEALLRLLPAILKPLGYKVECARDGAEAIAIYKQAMTSRHPFDAVVLDLTVPRGMGGLETAAKLKKINPSVALIVSSGYSDSPVMSAFRDYGFDDVIPKPWEPGQVAAVISGVLLSHNKPKSR